MSDLSRLRAVCDSVAIVGAGDTDYAADWRRAKDGVRYRDAYGYAAEAFRNALDDGQLRREEVDGLVAGPTTATERLGEVLGLDVRWSAQADAVNAVIQAVAAIHAGLAECVALVYGNDQKTAGTAYGGPDATGGDRYLSYVYYAPWGLTSQGALYALLASRYMALSGFTAEDLGALVIGQREFARRNPHAVMRKELTLPEYLASRKICEPLRLYDYCIVNDGGVALILTSTERARRSRRKPVRVAGIGRADMNCEATSLRPRLAEFYRPAQREAARQAREMCSIGPEEVDVLQVYDSFSLHLPLALEGFGFCAEGAAAGLVRSGALAPGGRLPLNTSGGMLSESYMQGWNHQVEAVRQLRGEAGDRQVPGARIAQYLSDVAGKAATLVYRASDA